MVLFQDIFGYTENSMPDHADFPPLQSIMKVFSLFKDQYQFENHEVKGV